MNIREMYKVEMALSYDSWGFPVETAFVGYFEDASYHLEHPKYIVKSLTFIEHGENIYLAQMVDSVPVTEEQKVRDKMKGKK